MSDLKLLPPDQPTALERRLLDAVAQEGPSVEQRMRVRQALGLANPSIAPAPTPVAAPTPIALGTKVAAVSLATGAVAVLLALSGVSGKAPHSAALPVASVVTPAAVPSATPRFEQPALVEHAPASAPPVASNTPAPRAVPKSGAPLPSSGSEPTAVQGDLSEQLRLIESARAAVAAHDAAGALSALSAYRQRFPRGAFGQEGTVLQIVALDLQGNHARAADQARAFLARHPNSPHVSVMQRIAER